MEEDLRKLIDDPRFREYHRTQLKPKGFNTFDVLQYSDYEIRHSNVLAWLLRPGDTHGIGRRFLEWLVDHVNKRLTASHVEPLPAVDLEPANVAVHREQDHVDIKVIFEREKCVIAVENKAGPAYSSHVAQVMRYERVLRRKHQGHRVKSVLLTTSPDGSIAFRGLAHVGWDAVHEAIGSFHEGGEFPSGGVEAFVRQYLTLVEEWVHPTGGEGFRALLEDHRSILKQMRRVLEKDGDNGVGRQVPVDLAEYRKALIRLVKESRQDPKRVRKAVAHYLKGRGCKTRSSNNPKLTHYWLRWTDPNLADAARSLGGEPDSLAWSMTFTHHGVSVGFHLYQHPGKQHGEDSLVKELKRFITSTPINRQNPRNYQLKGRGFGWDRVYHQALLSNDELADLSAPEVKDEVIRRLQEFMGSDESEYRRVDDYFRCLAFRPGRLAVEREDSR